MKVLGYILFVVFIGFCALAGLDREMARRDYLDAKAYGDHSIEDCIFKFNCDHYNEMLKKEEE